MKMKKHPHRLLAETMRQQKQQDLRLFLQRSFCLVEWQVLKGVVSDAPDALDALAFLPHLLSLSVPRPLSDAFPAVSFVVERRQHREMIDPWQWRQKH